MDKIEKIRKEIERRKGYISVTHFAEELLSFLDTLKEEPDKNLEESAIDFADNARKELFTKDYAISSIADYDHGCIDGFIAGAQWQEKRDEETIKTAEDHAFLAGADWQKEQMMSGTVEGEIVDSGFDDGTAILKAIVPDRKYDSGDKVKLIVIKED